MGTMKNKKITFILILLVLLSGCAQSSAFLGPAITVAATGNVAQAGFTYGTNEAIKRETGKDTVQYVSSLLEPKEKKATINEDLIALLENRIKKTRQKLLQKN